MIWDSSELISKGKTKQKGKQRETKQRGKQNKKGVRARFDPGSSKSLQKWIFFPSAHLISLLECEENRNISIKVQRQKNSSYCTLSRDPVSSSACICPVFACICPVLACICLFYFQRQCKSSIIASTVSDRTSLASACWNVTVFFLCVDMWQD